MVAVRDELAEERAPATVNRYLALMSHACTMAEREWEWMTENPMRKIGRLQESTGRVRYLNDAERGKLLNAARDSEHPQLYAIVLLALTSGARKSEILELRWTDVDLVKGRAVLQETKNRDRRTLTLVAPVVVELRKIQKVRRLDDGRDRFTTGKLRGLEASVAADENVGLLALRPGDCDRLQDAVFLDGLG